MLGLMQKQTAGQSRRSFQSTVHYKEYKTNTLHTYIGDKERIKYMSLEGIQLCFPCWFRICQFLFQWPSVTPVLDFCTLQPPTPTLPDSPPNCRHPRSQRGMMLALHRQKDEGKKRGSEKQKGSGERSSLLIADQSPGF